LAKRFRLPGTENTALEVRGEAFNILNHASFANPNGQIGSAAFGRISSTTVIPRQVQAALRLSF
jgi:hypothetical protein